MQPQYTKIYETIVGSTAYGLNVATSDVDKKGIGIPNIRHIFGLHPFEQHEVSKDHTVFSLCKFFKLIADANPNMLEMLYTDDADILYLHPLGIKLRDQRELFLSTKAKHTFSGYAFSQLERIKSHQKWINNPQEKPREEDYYITKYRTILDGTDETSCRAHVVTTPYTAFQENEYDAAYKKWQQYETWKKSHGYDSKHGMHLIRLLKMGLEIIREGKVIVKRPDREELLGIRNGKVPYQQLVDYAEKLMAELEVAYTNSPLPGKVDMNKIEDLMMEIQAEFYGIKI